MGKADRNSAWIGRVKGLMSQGYGYEDIAVKLGCLADRVRQEAQILSDMGLLDAIYSEWKKR